MQVYTVKWECVSCGQSHTFRYGLNEEDGWPNKFELTCENEECGQIQDVSFQSCTVVPARGTLELEDEA
jgi:hypothetical protein